VIARGSAAYKASMVGSEVGEPLKDGAALSLNILLKLTGMLSLIFADEFRQLHQ
jgi:Na+/H+-translocating membrane pyrophosphatase